MASTVRAVSRALLRDRLGGDRWYTVGEMAHTLSNVVSPDVCVRACRNFPRLKSLPINEQITRGLKRLIQDVLSHMTDSNMVERRETGNPPLTQYRFPTKAEAAACTKAKVKAHYKRLREKGGKPGRLAAKLGFGGPQIVAFVNKAAGTEGVSAEAVARAFQPLANIAECRKVVDGALAKNSRRKPPPTWQTHTPTPFDAVLWVVKWYLHHMTTTKRVTRKETVVFFPGSDTNP